MPPSTHGVANDTAAQTFGQPAICTLVHKRFAENVLLTGIGECGGDRFVCTGRIPTDHPFFNDGDRTPREDILFYTELGRQASLAVTHAFLSVGLEEVFVFERSEAAMTEAIWHPRQSPSDGVDIEITIRDLTRRKNNAVTRVVADHLMTVGGEPVFSGTGTWTVQSPALFKRLRRTAVEISSPSADPPAPRLEPNPDRLPPYPGNVVISAPEYDQGGTGVTASLIVDPTHAYFFDHPCDHVPGMLLLEGCAQLAVGAFASSDGVASRRPAIVAYTVDFTQFVECGVSTTLTARTSPDHLVAGATVPPVEIAIAQRGIAAGTARMTIGFSM
jgi:2-oxo-3-(phosphooxy)propyl 3-oxoalkanoate synthase